MTPQPQQDRCVLTRHDVQSIKDLVFIVGGNSESSAQKAIFEILANNMRRSRPHTSTPNPCEEQGCTDTEQCDEICEHSRIYSPAWVKEHDTAIRNSTLDEFYLRIKAERDPSLEYVDWDSIEAVFIRTQQEKP